MSLESQIKAADILVESGYAHTFCLRSEGFDICVITFEGRTVNVEPLKDTLEGRRQKDFIHDWLTLNRYHLWESSERKAKIPIMPCLEHGSFWYQVEVSRIEICLNEIVLEDFIRNRKPESGHIL